MLLVAGLAQKYTLQHQAASMFCCGADGLHVAAGQGTGSHKLAVSTAVVDRLRRRLRSNGFRAHLTLQMVPEDDDLISNVHITPLRASRALALRYLANKFNLDMERITVSPYLIPCCTPPPPPPPPNFACVCVLPYSICTKGR